VIVSSDSSVWFVKYVSLLKKIKKIMDLKKNENGFYYYDNPPEQCVIAKESDFFTERSILILKKPYIIQSYHNTTWWCARTNEWFTIECIRQWLEDGKVMVWRS
jgi:hypothetical protein